jgi:hypothetical protein
MPLDPSIAMGARLPQISVLPDSPVNAMARVEEVRGAQMANQLRAMQMQQAQREAQQNELANRLYAESIGEGGEIDYGKLMQGMAQGGMASRIPGVLEQRAATQSRASERQLREEQVRNQQLDAAYKMLKAATPENYAQLRAMGISRAPALANVLPEQFDQRVIDALTGQMEQYFAVQPGGQVFSRRTGQAVGEQVPFKPERPAAPPAPEAKTPTQREYETAVSQGYKGTILDFKRDVAAAGRAPVQPRQEPAPRTQQVTMADGRLGIMNMDTGVVTPSTVGGAPAMARPTAFGEKAAAQRKQLTVDIDRAITELTDATKKGGLIDQSTGSGIGRAIDIGAGFVGKATPGAIAGGKLAPIADMVLKMVPRFEGPQSDKDTRSYKEAAGQLADTSLPNEIRKQAGITILRLMRERKDQFVSEDMAREGVPTGRQPSASGGSVDMNNPLLR